MMTVSWIIVNYFQGKSIQALAKQIPEGVEILVVDHSEDEKEGEFLKALPGVRVLKEPNRGYGAGINYGVRHAKGDTLIASNGDMGWLAGSLSSLLEPLEDPQVGCVGPAFFWDPQGLWHLPLPYPYTFRWELLQRFFPKKATRDYLTYQRSFWEASSPQEAPVLPGTLLAFRRDVFDEVGGFDEAFFLYFEENDLCLRLRKQGKYLIYLPQVKVYHPFKGVHTRFYLQSEALYRKRYFSSLSNWLRSWLLKGFPKKGRGKQKWAKLTLLPSQGWLFASPEPSLIPATGWEIDPQKEGVPLNLLPPNIYTLSYWDGGFHLLGKYRVE